MPYDLYIKIRYQERFRDIQTKPTLLRKQAAGFPLITSNCVADGLIKI